MSTNLCGSSRRIEPTGLHSSAQQTYNLHTSMCEIIHNLFDINNYVEPHLRLHIYGSPFL